MKSIHADVFPIVGIASNCYILRSHQGALLIDTGLQGNIKKIHKTLTMAGLSLSDLKFILITHADGDHYGSLAVLQSKAPHAITCASQPEAEAITRGKMSRDILPKGIMKYLYRAASGIFHHQAARINRLIKKGDSFPWLDKLVVLDSRGHTPGHLSFFSEATGILFSGDSVLVHGRKLVPSSGANCWNEQLAGEVFDTQLALKPKIILGGHGIWQK